MDENGRVDANERKWTQVNENGRNWTQVDANGRKWTLMDVQFVFWTLLDAFGHGPKKGKIVLVIGFATLPFLKSYACLAFCRPDVAETDA